MRSSSAATNQWCFSVSLPHVVATTARYFGQVSFRNPNVPTCLHVDQRAGVFTIERSYYDHSTIITHRMRFGLASSGRLGNTMSSAQTEGLGQ
jgi:hypothetical protein